MKKSFSARRAPRKIGQDEEDVSPAGTASEQDSEPTLQRPTFKPRKGTPLRKSFGPTAVPDEDESESAGVVTPKRQGLSRIGSQKNASKRSSLLASSLATRQDDDDDDRPSYTAASLKELKNSTPTTPHDLATDPSASEVDDVEKSTQALDLSTKFGSSLSRYQQQTQLSAIPSTAEIAEKKARRARLAKESAADEFISLDPDNLDRSSNEDEDDDPNITRDDAGRLILKPKDKYGQAESRLVRDDEDIMEDFDDFTEADGKILLGGKVEAEAQRQRKRDMAARIADAEGDGEGSGGDSGDESEKERNAAFEAAQTKHGTYGSNTTSDDPYAGQRPRTPPKISPLPTLDGVLERLRGQAVQLQTERMRRVGEMEALGREKVRLGEEEVRIQRQLGEVGEWYRKLREEKGLGQSSGGEERTKGLIEDAGNEKGEEDEEEEPMTGAGLGFGGGAGAGLGFVNGSGLGFGGTAADEDREDEDEGSGRGGLGSSMAGRGLEGLGASAAGTPSAERRSPVPGDGMAM